MACFNAIDVVSRYPTGQAFPQRRSRDAAAFLVQVWQEIGIAQYTQVDNEGCFSGGATHPYVLGKVLRLALEVGTELLFSPVRHPESNGHIERFHRDYDQHVWEDTYLANLTAVNDQSCHFFDLYRQWEAHSRLQGQSPAQLHAGGTMRKLDLDFALSTAKQLLRPGRIHFMRAVQPDGTVRVLNVHWSVPDFAVNQGVWVTFDLQVTGATLSIYDAAPDAPQRTCLADYPFPLKEPVVPHSATAPEIESSQVQSLPTATSPLPPLTMVQQTSTAERDSRTATIGQRLLWSTVGYTVRFTRHFFHTMF